MEISATVSCTLSSIFLDHNADQKPSSEYVRKFFKRMFHTVLLLPLLDKFAVHLAANALMLLVTLPHVPFLFLLHQSGILYLHTSVLLIISLHLSAMLNHTFYSQLSLPSHPAPAPPIRSL